jgi:hypothetical protein
MSKSHYSEEQRKELVAKLIALYGKIATKEQIQNIMDIYQTLPEYVDCSFTEILAFNPSLM